MAGTSSSLEMLAWSLLRVPVLALFPVAEGPCRWRRWVLLQSSRSDRRAPVLELVPGIGRDVEFGRRVLDGALDPVDGDLDLETDLEAAFLVIRFRDELSIASAL